MKNKTSFYLQVIKYTLNVQEEQWRNTQAQGHLQ